MIDLPIFFRCKAGGKKTYLGIDGTDYTKLDMLGSP